MQTTVLLEYPCKTCITCTDVRLFIARLYPEAVESTTPFTLLPKYKGVCVLHIKDANVHVSALSIHTGEFLPINYLDLCLRVLEVAPLTETASWERHKGEGIKRTIRLVDTIRILTKRLLNKEVSNATTMS